MLRIRKEQLDAMRTSVSRVFKTKMVGHLRGLGLPPYRPRSEDDMTSLVDAGVERARAYGFTMEGSVRLFLELMFVFGDDFDRDPRFPWANQILRQTNESSECERANLLYNEAEKHRTSGASK